MSSMVRKLSAAITLGLLLSVGAVAGQVDSPAAPGEALSYMASLAELCARLDTGAPSAGPPYFVEPTTGPADNPVCSLAQALSKAPAPDNTNGAVTGDVLSGKTYWGLRTSAWGTTTGTMPNVGQQDITPSTEATTISPGFHNGSGSVEGDADLVTGNIRSGIEIFGVSGNSNVVNTSSGDAVAADIASGKKAWVDGSLVTGTDTGLPACGGVLSAGGRWCDNQDGTVTDRTSGLVWLQNAGWGGAKPWRNPNSPPLAYDDAHQRAGLLRAGSSGANLTDGSSFGEWRLPTFRELISLTQGPEGVSNGSPRLFTNLPVATVTPLNELASFCWSSTTVEGIEWRAFCVNLNNGSSSTSYSKGNVFCVWPVRDGG